VEVARASLGWRDADMDSRVGREESSVWGEEGDIESADCKLSEGPKGNRFRYRQVHQQRHC